jgi:hypothetical protein
MKCCHLVVALVLVGCGLDTAALPGTSRSSDAGVDSSTTGGRDTIAGAPASWPSRRRATPIKKDGGSADTKMPAGGHGGNGAQANPSGQQPSGKPNQGGASANPSGSSNPGGQANPSGQTPSNSGKGGQAKPGAQPGGSTSQPSSGNAGASSQGSQSHVDAGASSSADAGTSHSNAGSGNGNNPNQSGGASNGGPGSSGGNPPSSTPTKQVGGAIDAIVNLVLAILDLSLGPIRPVEIEQLVSAILVLSLSPAELVADSLIAVLDALDNTRICRDQPERCNPLCSNLESDCSVCGHDDDCIERVEEMCHVQLPRRCR